MTAAAKLVTLLLLVSAVGAQDAAVLREKVERFVQTTESLSYDDFCYGRFGEAWEGQQPELDELAAWHAERAPVEHALALLQHEDAKVRVVALMLLFDRSEPKLLPKIASFLGDDAECIPDRVRIAGAVIGGPTHMQQPCKVAAVAQRLLEFYYDLSGHRFERDAMLRFDAYWQPRRGRQHCLGWWRVRLRRAHGGVSPVRDNVSDRLAGVRDDVMKMPPAERDLLLVALPDSMAPLLPAFATDEERCAAARRLGDDLLLTILDGTFENEDPDIGLLRRDGMYRATHSFLLTPDHRIFSKDSADALLAIERAQRAKGGNAPGCTHAGFVKTAASLRPDMATKWLLDAVDRFGHPSDAVHLCEVLGALAEHGDEASESVVVEHFWKESFLQLFHAQMRARLLRGIGKRGGNKARRLTTALLAHESFDSADVLTTMALARLVGKLNGTPAIGEMDLQRLNHPIGLFRLVRSKDIAAARASHPAATKLVEEAAKNWREVIRAAWK